MSFEFSGNLSNYLSLRDSLSQDARQGPWTFAAKIYTDVNDDMAIISYGDGDSSSKYVQFQVSDYLGTTRTLVCLDRNGSFRVAQTSSGFSIDTWTYCIMTIEDTPDRNVEWDDGTSSSTGNNTQSLADTTGNDHVIIGQSSDSSPDSPFDGLLADLCVWSKVLSASEIQDYLDDLDPAEIAAADLDVLVYGRVDDANIFDNEGTEGGTFSETGSVPFNANNPPALTTSSFDYTITDSMDMGDTQSKNVELTRTITDDIDVGDTITTDLPALDWQLSDGVAMSDTITKSTVITRTFTESMGMGDTVTYFQADTLSQKKIRRRMDE